MKCEKWLTCLVSAVLAFVIAMAGVGCLVTAFSPEPVNMTVVAVCCGVFAMLASICLSFRRGGWVLLVLTALLAACLSQENLVIKQTEALVYQISKFYDRAYGWGVVRWLKTPIKEVPTTFGLFAWTQLVILAVAGVVCRGKGIIAAVAVSFLPLAACLVVTDTVPGELWVALLLGGLALLVLPQSVRRVDAKAGLRLTAIFLVPVILATWLLMICHPQAGYQSRGESLQQTILGWFGDSPYVQVGPDGKLEFSLDATPRVTVDLSAAGPMQRRNTPIMDVVADQGGLIYLRGQSMDTYSGAAWSASQYSNGSDNGFPSQYLRQVGRIRVSMRVASDRKYVPYYLRGTYVFQNGGVDNTDNLQEYQFMQMTPMSTVYQCMDNPEIYRTQMLEQCLQLPYESKEQLQELVQDILRWQIYDNEDYTQEQVEAIKRYVEGCAQYSLDVSTMPQGEDFALWFLQDGERGYCVHFATAMTVLLRAAGIPARYVEGYAFRAGSGEKTTVTAKNAHAWTEYLHPRSGWTVVDATPGVWLENTQEQTSEPTEEETRPIETQAQTQPVQTDPQATQATSATAESVINTPDTPQAEDKSTGTIIPWLLTVLGVVAAVMGQYGLRRGLRQRKLRKGGNNRRALAYYQESKRMARALKITLPISLIELAQKAKFSQHTLTEQELTAFTQWLAFAHEKLREKPIAIGLLLRLIWAV